MNENKNAVYFPLLLNLKNYPCLVVGGGKVAFRKVISLRDFQAKVTVISPKFCEPLLELNKKRKVKIIQKVYSKEYLKNYNIVFCATDNPKINKMVRKDCTEKNILLNVADIPELCDFILPAIVKRGDLTISVSSQGTAPFYVKEIKNKLDHIFPVYHEEIIELAGEFRNLILSDKMFKAPKLKEEAFMKFFMVDWKKVLANGGRKNANKYLQSILNDLKN